MTIFQQIPLIAGAADQTLDITLAEIPYTLRILWNERFGYWSLSIAYRDGEAILTNIKMVNNWPLLGKFQRLSLKGDFYFVHKAGKTYRPTYDDVGGEYGLYYFDPETVADLPLPIAPRGSTQSVWDGGNTIWIDGGVISNWV